MNIFGHLFKLCFLIIATYSLAQANTLKVATYNVGMLDTFVSSVPFRESREKVFEKALLDFIQKSDVDILAVQEAWTNFSVQTLATLSTDYTYYDAAEERSSAMLEHKTGLGFLVKNSLRASSAFIDFESRESAICGYGAVCVRGVQVLSFKQLDKTFFVLNTHLTPVYNYSAHRRRQISELNSIKFKLFMNHPGSEVIITGDYNVSPTFGDYREGDDGVVEDWQNNVGLFAPLLQGFGVSTCVDSYEVSKVNQTLSPYTQDRDRNNLTSFSASTNIEPNQRIDHIISCSSKDSATLAVVQSIEHIFTERYELNEGLYELSDHYGVMVEISYSEL